MIASNTPFATNKDGKFASLKKGLVVGAMNDMKQSFLF
jgi:hypothetical protein